MLYLWLTDMCVVVCGDDDEQESFRHNIDQKFTWTMTVSPDNNRLFAGWMMDDVSDDKHDWSMSCLWLETDDDVWFVHWLGCGRDIVVLNQHGQVMSVLKQYIL